MTPEILHLTHEMWHVTYGGPMEGEPYLKVSATLIARFAIYDILKI